MRYSRPHSVIYTNIDHIVIKRGHVEIAQPAQNTPEKSEMIRLITTRKNLVEYGDRKIIEPAHVHRPVRVLSKQVVSSLLAIGFQRVITTFAYKEKIIESVNKQGTDWRSQYTYQVPFYDAGTQEMRIIEIIWDLELDRRLLYKHMPYTEEIANCQPQKPVFKIVKHPESGIPFVMYEVKRIPRYIKTLENKPLPSPLGSPQEKSRRSRNGLEKTVRYFLLTYDIHQLWKYFESLTRNFKEAYGTLPFSINKATHPLYTIDVLHDENWQFIREHVIPQENTKIIQFMKSCCDLIQAEEELDIECQELLNTH